MKQIEAGKLNVVLVNEDQASQGLVVLFHGYGAPGTDLVPLANYLDPQKKFAFAFPAAPIKLPMFPPPMGARAWWNIDMMRIQQAMERGEMRQMQDEEPEGMSEARDLALDCIEDLKGTLNPRALVVGGFSQGAMLTTEILASSELELAGAILMSGNLLAQDRWKPALVKRKGLALLQSHGSHDPVLPFGGAEALGAILDEAGTKRSFVPFSGGHEIPLEVLNAGQHFIATQLG